MTHCSRCLLDLKDFSVGVCCERCHDPLVGWRTPAPGMNSAHLLFILSTGALEHPPFRSRIECPRCGSGQLRSAATLQAEVQPEWAEHATLTCACAACTEYRYQRHIANPSHDVILTCGCARCTAYWEMTGKKRV